MFLLTAWLACSSPPPPGPARPADRPPDMLVVVLDTVRADALSIYGNPRPTSPQLELLAAEGVVFEDATAPGSWTWPSHASLFTGEPPWVHGAHFGPAGPGALALEPDPFLATALREDLPTLAERLGAAGYRTLSLSANRLLAPSFGLTRGFERAETFSEDALVIEAARAALSEGDDRPLLLFVNLYGAHAPWFLNPVPWVAARRGELSPEGGQPWLRPYLIGDGVGLNIYARPAPGEPPLAVAWSAGSLEIPPEGLSLLRDLYEGEVSRVDYRLHQLIEAWTAVRGEGGVIAVTSDHGEYLGERQQLAHARTLFPEVTHIPLVLSAPGRLPEGARVTTPVQLQDLYGTLLHIAGLADTDALSEALSGAPPADAIRAAAWPDVYWAEQIGGRFAVGYRMYRAGSEAVILSDAGSVAYYSDPLTMREDRAAESPQRAATLAAAAARAFPEAAGTGLLDVAPEALEALEALGYTGD